MTTLLGILGSSPTLLSGPHSTCFCRVPLENWTPQVDWVSLRMDETLYIFETRTNDICLYVLSQISWTLCGDKRHVWSFWFQTLTNQAPGCTPLGQQIPTDSDHLSLAMDVNLPPCLHGFRLPSFFVWGSLLTIQRLLVALCNDAPRHWAVVKAIVD